MRGTDIGKEGERGRESEGYRQKEREKGNEGDGERGRWGDERQPFMWKQIRQVRSVGGKTTALHL